jgi:antitoxin component of MazEF toxin-antitoxin module
MLYYEELMNKKLTKHGNSLALVIDKPILELLKIKESTLPAALLA